MFAPQMIQRPYWKVVGIVAFGYLWSQMWSQISLQALREGLAGEVGGIRFLRHFRGSLSLGVCLLFRVGIRFQQSSFPLCVMLKVAPHAHGVLPQKPPPRCPFEMAYQTSLLGIGNGAGRASKDEKAPGGIRHQYRILDETVAVDGTAASRLLERTTLGEAYRAQTKINAFNFPFTGNSGGGCFFRCGYCFLRKPFFQMHRTLPHGREMDVTTNFAAATETFLKKTPIFPST